MFTPGRRRIAALYDTTMVATPLRVWVCRLSRFFRLIAFDDYLFPDNQYGIKKVFLKCYSKMSVK
jgi:hypothetical protein